MINEKGVAPVVLIFIGVIIAGSLVYFGFTKQSNQNAKPQTQETPTVEKLREGAKVDSSLVFYGGEYKSDYGTVKYAFTFPKNGGKVTGTVEGACTGTADGTFDGSDKGKIEGTFSALCPVGPVKVNAKGKYNGVVYLSNKKIALNTEVTEPIQQKYSFDLYYDSTKAVSNTDYSAGVLKDEDYSQGVVPAGQKSLPSDIPLYKGAKLWYFSHMRSCTQEELKNNNQVCDVNMYIYHIADKNLDYNEVANWYISNPAKPNWIYSADTFTAARSGKLVKGDINYIVRITQYGGNEGVQITFEGPYRN